MNAPVAPGVLLPARRGEAAPLGEALGRRVRFAGMEPPLWGLLLPLAAALALSVALVAVATTTSRVDAPRQHSASLSTTASAAVTRDSLAAGTATKSQADLQTLEGKPPLSLRADEVLRLTNAAADREGRAATAFREKLRNDPALVKDKAVLAELSKLIADPDSAREALAAVAEVPGPTSAELLYEIWTGTADRSDATELARALVYSIDVRGRATEALAVALDLRLAETCEQNKDLLPRALQHGDKRSFHLLAKLKRKQGCGANKRQDCYACLREGSELDDAIKAVKKRRAPTPLVPNQ